jgi:hypothetical protein
MLKLHTHGTNPVTNHVHLPDPSASRHWLKASARRIRRGAAPAGGAGGGGQGAGSMGYRQADAIVTQSQAPKPIPGYNNQPQPHSVCVGPLLGRS